MKNEKLKMKNQKWIRDEGVETRKLKPNTQNPKP